MNAAVPEPSFSALVQLLAGQAQLALGVPHPRLSEAPPVDLIAARFLIDLLAVLQERTEGHRSAAETQELEALLTHLRLLMVDRTSRPASAVPPGEQP